MATKPVDVLAVMDLARTLALSDHTRRDLSEARAAVAELIEAGRPIFRLEEIDNIESAREDDIAVMTVGTIRRLRAALARCGGAE